MSAGDIFADLAAAGLRIGHLAQRGSDDLWSCTLYRGKTADLHGRAFYQPTMEECLRAAMKGGVQMAQVAREAPPAEAPVPAASEAPVFVPPPPY